MALNRITFDNKVATRQTNLPRKNSITDLDVNEIKTVVNSNAELQDEINEQLQESVDDLQLSVDEKYDASNPEGYETPAQLNVRDTANRNRANHTGTQPASSISDFASAVDALDKDAIPMYMGSSAATAVTSTTYYFSGAPGITLRSTIDGLEMKPLRNGKIIGASFTRWISSILGNRSYSLYIRINNNTDYLVATVGTTALHSFFTNNSLNSGAGIPITMADTIVMKLVVSGGTTDSTNVLFFGNLLIVRQ